MLETRRGYPYLYYFEMSFELPSPSSLLETDSSIPAEVSPTA